MSKVDAQQSELTEATISGAPVAWPGVAELQQGYTRGGVKVGDVVGQYVARIEAANPLLKAFVDIDYDSIDAEIKISEASFEADTQKPLDGIPIAVTADFAVRGLSHHSGMIALDDNTPARNCAVVQKLRESGAVMVGTLNMDEAGLGYDSNNPFCGQVVNPHNSEFSAGGSAGGAAAAVAAGLCAAALGLDSAGGVRIPASQAGVFGYMPTPHQVSVDGIWPCVTRFDTVGVIARSMDDISFMANVLFTPDLATAMRRSRFLRLSSSGEVECDTGVSLAMAQVNDVLRDRSTDIDLSHSCREIAKSFAMLRGRALVTQIVSLGQERCARLSAQFEQRVDWLLDFTDKDFDDAELVIETTANELRTQIASNGILVMPTTPQTATKLDEEASDSVADFAILANVGGLPAVTIPAGVDEQGLPVGVMLVGPVGGDAMVIAQARMLNDTIRAYIQPNIG